MMAARSAPADANILPGTPHPGLTQASAAPSSQASAAAAAPAATHCRPTAAGSAQVGGAARPRSSAGPTLSRRLLFSAPRPCVCVPAWQQHPSPLWPTADDKFAAFLRTIISSVLPSILLSVWQAVVLPLWFYTCAQVHERAMRRGGAALPLRSMVWHRDFRQAAQRPHRTSKALAGCRPAWPNPRLISPRRRPRAHTTPSPRWTCAAAPGSSW